jgi:hypothetical protein
MKRIKKSTWFYWLFLFWGISAKLIFPGEKILTDSSKTGILTIQRADSTLNIFIDGKFVGYSTTQKHPISSGKHEIQLTPSDQSVWRVGDWKKEFKIATGESLTIKIPEIKYLYINSVPFDAVVTLNDSISGKTPLFITVTDSAHDVLRIQKSGYLDYWMEVKAIKTNYLNVKLEKDKQVEETTSQEVLNLKNKRTQKKLITYSLIGLTLISGISTIYLREEADQYYDKYLTAGQPAEMDHLYAETQKYDQYTAIAYGTFQLGFVTTLFFLFKK